MKLTDAEWQDVQDTAASYDDDSSWRKLVDDHRELLALINTPIPCGFDEPRFVRQVGHGGIDGVEWNPFGTNGNAIVYEPDEAEAIGAGLIRAAMKARGVE